jgi:hypothetical protein
MNFLLLAIPLAVVVACSAFADEQPPKAPTFKPRRSSIMSVTQSLHYKVWYAGRNRNWALADYEQKRLKDAFEDAITLYPGLAQADMTIMEKPAAKVDAAIKAKYSAAFARAFVGLATGVTIRKDMGSSR